MGKRLVLILALVLAVGVCAAYAEVQNVKVGGELTTLSVQRNNFDLGSSAGTAIIGGTVNNASILAMIAKVKIDADLTDAVMVNMALRNESVWGSTARTGTSDDNEVDFAAAYVTLKEFLNEAVTLKVGKMPFVLGSGLLVADSDTNRVSTGPFNPGFGDLSSRKSFTGGAAILNYSPLTVTLAALKVTETVLTGDYTNAYVASIGYKINDKNTAAFDYVLSDTENNDINNYGVRMVSNVVDNLSLTGEYVYQTQNGKANIRPADQKQSSDNGMLLTANLNMPDMKMTPNLGLIYLRVSDNWNSMFEGLTAGDIINAILPLTDCQVIGATLMAKPMDDVTLNLGYTYASLLTPGPALTGWTTNTTVPNLLMTDKKALGNEVDLKLSYDYTEDVQLALAAGYFLPGKAFNEVNRKSASQVIGSMKVTF